LQHLARIFLAKNFSRESFHQRDFCRWIVSDFFLILLTGEVGPFFQFSLPDIFLDSKKMVVRIFCKK